MERAALQSQEHKQLVEQYLDLIIDYKFKRSNDVLHYKVLFQNSKKKSKFVVTHINFVSKKITAQHFKTPNQNIVQNNKIYMRKQLRKFPDETLKREIANIQKQYQQTQQREFISPINYKILGNHIVVDYSVHDRTITVKPC